jgi:predicted ATP-grasp superfamily ATP-dependent carboligase
VFAVRDAQAVQATERFLAEIGYTGFFCFDWVVDDHGTLKLIDFNSRVRLLARPAGGSAFDFLSAYAYVLGAPAPAGHLGGSVRRVDDDAALPLPGHLDP